jgi:hypothetical protein
VGPTVPCGDQPEGARDLLLLEEALGRIQERLGGRAYRDRADRLGVRLDRHVEAVRVLLGLRRRRVRRLRTVLVTTDDQLPRRAQGLVDRNQTATRLLGSVLTDQFTGRETDAYSEAETLFKSLADPYQRLYRTGLLRERRAKAELRAGRPPHRVAPLLREALQLYEQAERIRPPGNDEAILRWNRCIRLIRSRPDLEWSVAETQ